MKDKLFCRSQVHNKIVWVEVMKPKKQPWYKRLLSNGK